MSLPISKKPKARRIKEQQLLFSEDFFLPKSLPRISELRASHNLSAVFDECHNYIYANEGFLKEKMFHEMVKLLFMKLFDEQNATGGALRFGITSSEYRSVVTKKPNSFETRIKELFARVRDRYGELFADDSLKLNLMTLAYVVGQLQHLSLIKTPGDVKGEAFQAFVYRHQRGDRGEFFTPYPIVNLAVAMIDPKPNERIIDPACGSGGFLIQAISYVQDKFPGIDKTSYVKKHLRGVEFNPDIATSATLRLAFEGGSGEEIACTNALVENQQLDNAFDIVLTNPPFGSKGKVKDRRILKSYVLARKWHRLGNGWKPTKTVLAGQSPEILFIEKCLKLLRPGGRMAIVLPDGLLQNVSSRHIRFWIRSQATVLGVVSIPQEAFIPYGTGIKTSLLLIQKHPSSAKTACFMARIEKVGYDVKGQPIYKRDNYGKPIKTEKGMYVIDEDIEEIASAYRSFRGGKSGLKQSEKIFIVPEKLLNLRLDVEHYHPEDQKIISHLKANGAKPLGEIADILRKPDGFKKTNEEIRYIAISNVDARTMQVVSQQVMKSHEAPSRAKYRLCKGDIITAISGASTGTHHHATALITEDEDGAICSNGFAVLRNIRGVDPFYLLAYMRTDFYLRQVRRLLTGHAIPSITLDDFSRVLVFIPPRDAQQRIANSMANIQAMRKEATRASEMVVRETEHLISH